MLHFNVVVNGKEEIQKRNCHHSIVRYNVGMCGDGANDCEVSLQKTINTCM